MASNDMIWDLSQLVGSSETSSIQAELDKMILEAEQIRDKYHGKIGDLDAKGLSELLNTRDSFVLKFEGPVRYCILLHSADSTNATAKQLNEAARTAMMKTEQTLAFVDIELGKALAANQSLIKHPELVEFRHYLEMKFRKVPHMLTEAEERVVIGKDKNGVNAWQLLQNDWLSTRTFEIEIEGKKRIMPYGEITGLYQSPNRELRKNANQTVYEHLGKDDIIWASAIRAICDDHLVVCGLRKYPNPMTQSLIDNDVDQETIDSLMRAILNNVGLYRRYLKLKAKLLKLEKLANYDIMAPLPEAPQTKYDWQRSRNEVQAAYDGFDPQLGEWVNEMYAKRHIDGEVRKGKESGAFCARWLSGKSAYILQSFNGRMGDVFAQAHELGHAMHDYLSSRAQKPSNCEFGSCIAETGSIFGELLLTERLLDTAKTKAEKQAILTTVLDEFGMSAFQVSARVIFEQSMYDSIKAGTFLDGETIAKLWDAARDKIYGESIDWLDVMKWEWTMKLHYYLANYRFYNYPYVFAQLFVYALYQLYKEQGKSFAPKLKTLLGSGSSKSPRELAAELGFDIIDEKFWEKGMRQAESFLDMLEATM